MWQNGWINSASGLLKCEDSTDYTNITVGVWPHFILANSLKRGILCEDIKKQVTKFDDVIRPKVTSLLVEMENIVHLSDSFVLGIHI